MRTPRDLTRQQFTAALKRFGFRQVLVWIEDTSGAAPGKSWGALMHDHGPRRGQIARRATLAYVIREREKLVQQRFEEAA